MKLEKTLDLESLYVFKPGERVDLCFPKNNDFGHYVLHDTFWVSVCLYCLPFFENTLQGWQLFHYQKFFSSLW